MNQLGGLENDIALYEEKGAQIIAIAVQTQAQAAESVEKSGAGFPILADSDHTVAEAYGVTSRSLGLGTNDSSQGAVFILNSDGLIVWEYLAKSLTDRAPSETILENLP